MYYNATFLSQPIQVHNHTQNVLINQIVEDIVSFYVGQHDILALFFAQLFSLNLFKVHNHT